MKISKRFFPAALFLGLPLGCLLPGCLLGPDYEKPKTDIPTQENFLMADPAVTNRTSVLLNWWEGLSDPVLNNLIQKGLEENLDLQIGLQRIRQTRTQLVQSRAGLWPTLDASGGMTRAHTWGSTSQGWDSTWRAGFDAGWELDIFGATRRGIEAAEANIAAQLYNQRDLEVALAAEIATTYLNVRMLQELLDVTHSNLVIQAHSTDITRKLYQAKVASGLDMSNADALYHSTMAQLPTMEASLAESILLLENLLGLLPYQLNEMLRTELTFPSLPDALPALLPNELLRRRADIRRAEEQVKAASAQIGITEASLYPRFSLLGGIGLSTPNLTQWNDVLRSASFGPSFSWNLFTAGRIRAQIEERKAAFEEAVLTYRKTVLNAWQECESVWQNYIQETLRSEPLEKSVASNQRALTIANQLYTSGQNDYTDVLIAQRSLLSAEDALARHRALLFQKLVAIYKALGGGWSEQDDAAAQEPDHNTQDTPSDTLLLDLSGNGTEIAAR